MDPLNIDAAAARTHIRFADLPHEEYEMVDPTENVRDIRESAQERFAETEMDTFAQLRDLAVTVSVDLSMQM